jgi:hypothetical protein
MINGRRFWDEDELVSWERQRAAPREQSGYSRLIGLTVRIIASLESKIAGHTL